MNLSILLFAALPLAVLGAAPSADLLPLEKVEAVRESAKAVELMDRKLYVASAKALYIFDVTVPDKPKLLGKADGIAGARQIAVRPGLAAVSARGNGVWLVDIADPRRPRLLPRCDAIELATGVHFSGRYLFIADRIYGAEILDTEDPLHPRFLGAVKTPEAQSLVYDHGRLFTGNWAAGEIQIFDIRDPRKPVPCGKLTLDGYGDGLAVRGDLVYAATGHHRKSGPEKERHGHGHALEIFDIRDLKNPVRLSRTAFPPLFTRGNDYWTARVSGHYAYVADTFNGLYVLDVSDPRAPKRVAHAQMPPMTVREVGFDGVARSRELPEPVGSLAVGDGVVYLAGPYSGLYIARLPGIAKPVDGAPGIPPELTPAPPEEPDPRFFVFRPEGQVRHAEVDDDFAWVAAGRGGLHLVKFGPNGISPVRHWPLAWCYDVRRRGGLLVTAEGEGGIAVYRIGADRSLEEIGRVKTGRIFQRLWLPEGSRYAVTTAHDAKVDFVDLADPEHPKIVFSHGQTGVVYGDLVGNDLFGGKYMYQNWHSGGFAWYDVSGDRPAVANFEKKRGNFGHINSVAAYRGKAFLMVRRGKFALLEPNQPGPQAAWPGRPIDAAGGIPRFDGDTLVFTNRPLRRIETFDLADPDAPKKIKSRCYGLASYPEGVSFWKHRMVIPAGYGGLLLERRAPKP